MSVNTLSNISGVATRTIQTWEAHAACPSDEQLIRIGDALQAHEDPAFHTSEAEFPAYFLALGRRLLDESHVGQDLALARRRLLIDAIRQSEAGGPEAPPERIAPPYPSDESNRDSPDDESPPRAGDAP